jgi:uncharacterized protein YndB with AHSA1/START domain
MKTSVQRIHIDAPPEVAFAYMADVAKVARMNHMTITTIHETPDKVGTTYAFTYRLLGLPATGTMVITEYVQDQRLAFRASHPCDCTSVWTFAPADGGTDFTSEGSFRSAIPGLGALYARLMGFMFRTGMGPRMKDRIERHARELAKAA